MTDLLKKTVVTGLGTGYLPVWPGTWGSGVICLIYLLAGAALGYDATWLNIILAAMALLSSSACVLLGPYTVRAFGRSDPTECTIDEFAGQAIALLLLPLGEGIKGLLIAAAVAFLAFRVLDVIKPPPARQAERLPLGWGILTDDIVAGIYANIVAQLVLRLWLAA